MLRQTKNSCHPNQHIIFLWTTLRETKFSECDLGSTSSVQFSRSVVSDSLRPHGLQHARPPCPSSTPRACWNSYPSSQWCHPTISSSVIPFSFCLQSFPASGSFRMKSVLLIGWPKYRSFSFNISPYSEHSGLISFRMDWLDLLAIQGTLKSSPTPQFKSIEVKSLSCVRLFAMPWTVAYYTPLSMGFSRQEYWSGVPFPSPEDLPDPGIEPRSLAL